MSHHLIERLLRVAFSHRINQYAVSRTLEMWTVALYRINLYIHLFIWSFIQVFNKHLGIYVASLPRTSKTIRLFPYLTETCWLYYVNPKGVDVDGKRNVMIAAMTMSLIIIIAIAITKTRDIFNVPRWAQRDTVYRRRGAWHYHRPRCLTKLCPSINLWSRGR